MPIKFKVDIETAATEAGMKQARTEVFQRLATGVRTAGERIALPGARQLAPSKSGRLRSSLVVKASASGGRGGSYGIRAAYLTTGLRGKQGRYVGVQEFGGVLRKTILPRKRKALYFGGRFVSVVKAPRVIKGQHFMLRAVQAGRPRMQDAIREEVMHAFDGFGS